MALRVIDSNPENLVSKIKTAIVAGHITTWTHSVQHGKDHFTHRTPDQQWENKAWMVPAIGSGEVLFNIVSPLNGELSTRVYAIYHGRFLEMLLAHFDQDFSNAMATALATVDDIVK